MLQGVLQGGPYLHQLLQQGHQGQDEEMKKKSTGCSSSEEDFISRKMEDIGRIFISLNIF